MANTARDLIIDAYRACGIRSKTMEPNGVETKIGLSLLNNDLIDQIRNNQFFNSYIKSYTVLSENGKTEYTVGEADPIPTNPQPDIVVSQDIIKIVAAQVQVGTSWTPMRGIDPTDFYRTSVDGGALTIPSTYTFNRSMDGTFNTISFTQPTQGGYMLRFGVNGPVQNYGLDDEMALPSGYYAYLKYGLAELLALEAGLVETEAAMRRKNSECLQRIELVNASQPPLLKTGYGNAIYNIGNDSITTPGGI